VGEVEDWAHTVSVSLYTPSGCRRVLKLTLLNAVLLGLALALNLARDALDALVIVVLSRAALLGV
jgi:hypothetical protein